MPRVQRWRFKPDMNRSTLETLAQSVTADEQGNPQGTLTLPIQIISWDTADLAPADYKPGDPATERFLTIVDEETVQVDAAVLGSQSGAQVRDTLNAAGDAWATGRKSLTPALERIFTVARRMVPRAIP